MDYDYSHMNCSYGGNNQYGHKQRGKRDNNVQRDPKSLAPKKKVAVVMKENDPLSKKLDTFNKVLLTYFLKYGLTWFNFVILFNVIDL